jgi:hypothetical protein
MGFMAYFIMLISKLFFTQIERYFERYVIVWGSFDFEAIFRDFMM